MLNAVGTQARGHLSSTTFVVIGLIFALIGVAHVAFPRLFWQMWLRRYRYSADREPTGGYTSVRIGGAVLAALGLVILVVAALH